jgi:hypothetical protein
MQIANDLNVSERFAYLLKFRLIEFSLEELSFLSNYDTRSIEILSLVSLYEFSKREILLSEFQNIYADNNPFELIENIINSKIPPNLLDQLSSKYWSCIYDYLIERSINTYPFNLTSINFIKSISKTKFSELSEKQKKWINNLIMSDHNGFDPNPIFCNRVLLEKGLSTDFELINKYFNSLN